jgi:hypothetical protein
MIPLLLALAFFQPFFQPGQECRSCDALMGMAGALSNSDGPRFMDYIDKSAPKYAEIETDVTALTAQNSITASLDVLKETGDDEHVEVLVDWFMQINSDDALEHTARRRMRVTIVERMVKKHWKVVSITPLSILDPATK